MSRIAELLHRKSVRQFLLYATIGTFATLIDCLLFALFTGTFGLAELVANLISYPTGLIISFFLNFYFNFRSHGRLWLRLLLFFVIGEINLGISEAVLALCIHVLSLDEMLAKIISVLFVALSQFFFNKYITFKEAK